MKRPASPSSLRSWLIAGAALALIGTTAIGAQSAQSPGKRPHSEALKFIPPPPDEPGDGGGGGNPTARNGMTWLKIAHDSSFGADNVDCYGCNAYVGDTLCKNFLPILCIKVEGSPNPGIPTTFYSGWAGGNIALTLPVQGTSLGNPANANAMCQAYHGAGWRMAEFHDGSGGWGWWAYGNVSDSTRFWTYINDQPANCWN